MRHCYDFFACVATEPPAGWCFTRITYMTSAWHLMPTQHMVMDCECLEEKRSYGAQYRWVYAAFRKGAWSPCVTWCQVTSVHPGKQLWMNRSLSDDITVRLAECENFGLALFCICPQSWGCTVKFDLMMEDCVETWSWAYGSVCIKLQVNDSRHQPHLGLRWISEISLIRTRLNRTSDHLN